MWFYKRIFLSFSRVCNFYSGIFRAVYFPFWQISIVDFLSFSWVWFFYHFPGCVILVLVFSRLCIFHFWYFPGCAISILAFSKFKFSVIFRGSICLSFSGGYNFRSSIFQCVHFPFWQIPTVHLLSISWAGFFVIFQGVHFPFLYFPGCAFSILVFSRVCNFGPGIFQIWYFSHFPECDFSVIFQGVQFLFWHFLGKTFSILANSNCAFSVIFRGVIFLSFSRGCNFRSGIFHGVHFPFGKFQMCIFCHFVGCTFSVILQGMQFPFWYFPGCAFSILVFSRVCNFHSGIFQILFFCHFLGCDFSLIFRGVQFLFWHFPGCAFSILANYNCAFSFIFQGVIFMSFSRVCNFHSGIFQAWFSVIFQGLNFLSISGLYIAHSGIFQVVHFPFWQFLARAISASP